MAGFVGPSGEAPGGISGVPSMGSKGSKRKDKEKKCPEGEHLENGKCVKDEETTITETPDTKFGVKVNEKKGDVAKSYEITGFGEKPITMSEEQYRGFLGEAGATVTEEGLKARDIQAVEFLKQQPGAAIPNKEKFVNMIIEKEGLNREEAEKQFEKQLREGRVQAEVERVEGELAEPKIDMSWLRKLQKFHPLGDKLDLATGFEEALPGYLSFGSQALDSVRSGVGLGAGAGKTLKVSNANKAFSENMASLNLNLQAMELGYEESDDAMKNLIAAEQAMATLESTTKGIGKANLNYWVDEGASIEAEIINQKEAIARMKIKYIETIVAKDRANIRARYGL